MGGWDWWTLCQAQLLEVAARQGSGFGVLSGGLVSWFRAGADRF